MTSEEINAIYKQFGPDVAFLLDKVGDHHCENGRHTTVPREVRQRLFKALRQAIPDEWLFDPELGQYFWAHLAIFYRKAHVDQALAESMH
ncbi:MAG: hypothetical protein ABI165_15220 [Bryobacteraceae bacterium]